MKKLFVICIFLIVNFQISLAQGIQEMQWDNDFQIHISLANDSNYMLDIKELHHTNVEENSSTSGNLYSIVSLLYLLFEML